ncbi:MAG: family 20 glycosylhydrolase [Flavobacteriaceae bacterium]
MKTLSISAFALFFLLIGFNYGCSKKNKRPAVVFPDTDLSESSLIPIPRKLAPTFEAFGLDQYTAIKAIGTDSAIAESAEFLAEKIRGKTGLVLEVNPTDLENIDRMIYIQQTDLPGTKGKEAYQIDVKTDSIMVNAAHPEAIFRAIQTLRQLIPETSNDTLADRPIWVVPTGEISDEPFFGFRGSMLDVARHFFSVGEVKKYIDLLAYYKINVLHLHLSDDQGWRIEIKSWPKLTTIGGSTEVGGTGGGFFTQEDYKEIVEYAARHYMTIIPEIDMPGHTNAASVAYPFLDGTGNPLKLYEGTRVGFSTFDTRKDSVYAFIDDVVGEIAAITPGPYFHIGGDESHATRPADYIHFVNKVEKIVQKHGKRMIGWDEVATADVDNSSIAQFWSSEDNASLAVKKGMKIIISPAKKAYLDMKYDTVSKHGLTWAAYIPVDTAYNWSPERYAEGIPRESILGVEAPLWSETISNSAELEYLAFPRVIGYSELSWSLPEKRNWEGYKKRLAEQAPFLDRMEVNFYRSDLIDWQVNKYTYKEIPLD